jgi:hypothetical protein
MPDFKPATASPTASKLGKFSGIMVGKRKGGGITSALRVIAPAAKKPDVAGSAEAADAAEDKNEIFKPAEEKKSLDQVPKL